MSAGSVAALTSPTALADKVRKLEEALQNERLIRETTIVEERRAREREVRILREALHPFYKREEDMKRKLVELEDRIEANYDEHVRLRDRMIALDDSNMGLEKRIEEVEDLSVKRRRVSRPFTTADTALRAGSRGSGKSSPKDRASHGSASSRPISPIGPARLACEDEEARSSGNLNLLDYPEPPPYASPLVLSTGREEVRSSGFLELSLAERLASKALPSPLKDSGTPIVAAHGSTPFSGHHDSTSPLSIVSLLVRSHSISANDSKGLQFKGATHEAVNQRNGDHELMPLEVLASVSAASSMAI